MEIAAIAASETQTGAIQSVAGGLASLTRKAGGSNQSTPFAELFTDSVSQIDKLESDARVSVDHMMTGSDVDVHQAMIATQKASMAFELALAVRNKAVQAYQSVMGMQF